MLFQVLKDKKVMFWTEHKDCIPSEETIKTLRQAGCKIKQKE